MKKFELPLSAGIKATFGGGVLEAVLGTSTLQKMAAVHVMEGGILRLDAVLGQQLVDLGVQMAEPIDPAGWYGTLEGVPVAIGPFDRKSQAMNGLVLSLVGLEVEPIRQPKAEGLSPEAQRGLKAEQLAYSLAEKGIPEDVASVLAGEIFQRFPDAEVKDVNVVPTLGGGIGAIAVG